VAFSSFIETMKLHNLGFCVEGFINIEGGTASVATEVFDTVDCDCIDSGLGVPQEQCDVCLRGPGKLVSCSAGSGDGVYAILGIYPLHDPKKRLGALAVFDWGYQLANSARARVEVDNSLGFAKEELTYMGGSGLAFSMDELKLFEHSKPVPHGSLSSSGRVFFSDNSGHRNANYAIVDVALDSESLDVIIFAAEDDPYHESLKWEGSGAESEIIKNSMFESLGLTPSDPTYFPQILMVLDSETTKLFDFSDQLPRTDWAVSVVHAMSRIGTSHLEPQHVSTYWVNALLARTKFRLALARDEGTELPDHEAALDQMMSWALLGEISGDLDATKLLDEMGLRDLAMIPDYRAAVLDIRGWDDPLAEEPEKDQDFASESLGVKSSSGLTKSSTKSGLGLGPALEQSNESGSNFCTNCGLKFENLEANFCQTCGTKRLGRDT
jgi:hypothetical protein